MGESSKTKKHLLSLLSLLALMVIMISAGKTESSAAVANCTQTKHAKDSITVTWYKLPADYYYLGISEDENEAETLAKAHTITLGGDINTYTFTGLKQGTEYNIAIRRLYTGASGEKAEETISNKKFRTIPGKITGLMQTKWFQNKKTVYVQWDAQTAGWYEYVFMSKTGKELSKGSVLSNTLRKSIDNKKCYSVKVRAVAIIGTKKYEGDYSDITYLFAQPRIVSYNYGNDYKLKISGGKLSLEWKKVKEATGYNIYVSTKRDSGYRKVTSVKRSKTKATVGKYKGKSFSSKKTYYVYVEAVRKKGSNISNSGICYVYRIKNGKTREDYYHGSY